MTSPPPPPLAVPGGPATGAPRSDGPSRVPGAVILLASATVVCLVAALGCMGLLTGGAARSLDLHVDRVEADIERRREEQGVLQQADQALESLADQLDSIRALEFSYPVSLPERAPEDPWGTPIEYRRTAEERAEIRSAGPDRKPGTGDDRVLRLPRY